VTKLIAYKCRPAYSESRDIPFPHQTYGFLVPALEIEEICAIADTIRTVYIGETQIAFPIMKYLQEEMPMRYPLYNLSVVDDPLFAFKVRQRKK
jgi:hypothetical protein